MINLAEHLNEAKTSFHAPIHMTFFQCYGSGSVSGSFLDPDPYSEYESGSTHVNTVPIGKIELKRLKI